MIIPGKWEESSEFVKELEEYKKNPNGFRLFSGKNGNGKSYCAMTVYEARSSYKLPYYNHDESRFVNQTELNILFNKNNSEHGQVYYLLDELIKTKFLVLDDIGTRTPSEAFMDFLYAIADKRYSDRHKLGTIITTNLNANMMREKFGRCFFKQSSERKMLQI